MQKNILKKIKQKYLNAAISAIIAGFTAINLYPAYHGFGFIQKNGLLALSAAVLALLGYTIYQGMVTDEQSENDTVLEAVHSDMQRLKKMALLWNIFAVVLCISLIRYPLYDISTTDQVSVKSIVSIGAGAFIAIFAVINAVLTVKYKLPLDAETLSIPQDKKNSPSNEDEDEGGQ